MPRSTTPPFSWPVRLLAVIVAVLVFSACAPEELPAPAPPADFLVSVQVRAPGSNDSIVRARVVLYLPGQPPHDALTDSDGFVTFRVDQALEGQTADMEVEAEGYAKYDKQIQIRKNEPSYEVKLVPLATQTPAPPTQAQAPTSTPTPTPAPTPTPIPSARITSHADGAQVARFISLIGGYSANMTDELWVFVQPDKGNYYAQSPNTGAGERLIRKDGRWEVRIGVGLDEDTGKSFDVILASMDAEADQFIRNSLIKSVKDNFFPGFAELPPGARELHRITVRRMSDIYGPPPDASNAVMQGQITIARYPGDQVTSEATITGTYSTALSDDIWIFVFPFFGRWYPQSTDACVGAHANRSSNGLWWVKGVFGNDQDAGKPFDIVAVVANPEASHSLDAMQREWCANNNYRGYLTIELPLGIMEKDRYRIHRK